MTKALNPNESVRRNVCLMCEAGPEDVGELLPVSYPPLMQGGLICSDCYDSHDYIVVSSEVTAG